MADLPDHIVSAFIIDVDFAASAICRGCEGG